ncbi:MAG: hypothetical protein R3281_04955 [Balneolaceae bacterium]|nr:hypothetical protein [Balneolaceae bacterium]
MYVLDYHKQITLIREMVQLRKDDEKWEAYYHHPSTNEMWKSFFPKANGQKRGPKLLRTEPVTLPLEERLNVSLSRENPDNAKGLAIELSVQPDRWVEILDLLEEHYRSYLRSQLSIFLDNLGIYRYGELFGEMGFTPEQFGLDEDRLTKMTWRIRKIKLKKLLVFW